MDKRFVSEENANIIVENLRSRLNFQYWQDVENRNAEQREMDY